MAAGTYQKYFNRKIVDLILASGNQKVIDRFLSKSGNTYLLSTNRNTGFNAGHYVSGDRISSAQELALELAKQNLLDGPQLERQNPGMCKSAVIVEIGNGVKIPIERYTALSLELDGILPKGTGVLPDRPGWTRAEMDNEISTLSLRIDL
jgi:hypothetical protein